MIENQQSATDDRTGGCLYVENSNAGSYLKVTGCNETDERQWFSYTFKGQLMVSGGNVESKKYITRAVFA